MTSGIDQIDFKVVFDKLLEINERSVEQLIRFKDMLNKNNDQFDDIIDKIDKISQSLNKFETTIQIIQSKKPLDTLENIDDRTHEEFKNLSNLFADIKNVVNDIHHLQSQFKQNTKDEIKEINNILSSVSKSQENFNDKNTVLADDIKSIRATVEDFNRRASFENKLNKVINAVVTALMLVTAYFAILKK